MTDRIVGTAIDDDLLAPELVHDPYPRYARLRAEDPVHWNTLFNFWEVTRYADVAAVLDDAGSFSAENYRAPAPPAYPPLTPAEIEFFGSEESKTMADPRVAPSFIMRDPPAHTAKRALVHRSFAENAVARWRPFVRSAVDDLLDAAEAKGGMEVMIDLATAIPFLVIATMMGVPRTDQVRLRELVEQSVNLNGTGEDRLFKSVAANRELDDYLGAIAAERGQQPEDDLLSLLVKGRRDGVLTHEEVMSNAYMMFVAGHETTMYAIGNSVLAFLRHPEQWKILRGDVDRRATSATEECLRYDAPVSIAVMRVATQDTELAGKVIRKGDFVRYVLPSANRDDAVFPDPDRFDITRRPNKHLAFGGGVHKCLGMTIARVEIQEVLRALAQRFQTLSLAADDVEYIPNTLFRGLRSLPVTWS